MTGVLLGLVGIVVGLVGGYLAGVAQARNERRDNALADIYKTLMLFHRCLIGWSSRPNRKPIVPPEAGDIEWWQYCDELYDKFTEAYYGNSIWLGRDTDELIGEFAAKGRSLLDAFAFMDPATGRLSEGTDAKEHLRHELAPMQREIREKLRAEIEASRYLIPYRFVIKKNERS